MLYFVTKTSKETTVKELHKNLANSNLNIRRAIAEKELYFRVSLVGGCNLSCPFCHNEGAPNKGKLDLAFAIAAIEAAAAVGFTRVQFTGGEPLLHPLVADFVRDAKKVVSDVGITTNGTFLEKHIHNLIGANLTRLHISLQIESLIDAGESGAWGIPKWLAPALHHAAEERFNLRLNMPIPAENFTQAQDFFQKIALYGCDLKVFSILPSDNAQNFAYPLDKLEQLVEYENRRRHKCGQKGTIIIRGYSPPKGIRCKTCLDYSKCKEQSHSLRLGADRMLRPCLATRAWDSILVEKDMKQQITEATLLALDY